MELKDGGFKVAGIGSSRNICSDNLSETRANKDFASKSEV